MKRTVELLLDAKAELGECPRWSPADRQLYWVDIAANTLHRLEPECGRHESRQFDAPIGCFAFRQQGGFVLGMKDGFATLADWDAVPQPFGKQMLADRPDLRLNDGRTDPAGRFWAGTVNTAKSAQDAAFYRLDPDGGVTEIQGGMLTCNGAAFTGDGRRFFHADTPSHALRVYDADPYSGTLSNERVLHQWPHGKGRPDGGSADQEGCYWTALFDGSRVARLSAQGEVLEEVPLPVTRPTMICLGGGDGRTAFVTTARTGLDAAALAVQPLAGGLFTFRVDVPGVPEFPFTA